jgi:SNF2 family DNA or RNA helicase
MFTDLLIASQAIARSHRFGQTKTCLVFKLMVKASAEGLLNRQAFKQTLKYEIRTDYPEWKEENGA